MIWEAIAGLVKGVGDTALSIIDELTLSPEEKLKAKQAFLDAQAQFRQAVWQLEDADRADARKRETATGDPTTRRLAYIYTFGYFGALTILLMGWVDIPDNMKGLIDVLMGVLTAGQYSIMSYYFGSSHGSAQKDKTIDRVVNHNA